MLEDIDAVIFDLDGTLVDSMGIWKDIDIAFLSERNLPFEENLQYEIEGMSFTETAEFFRKHFQLTESVEELKQIWNEMARQKYRYEIPMKQGAKDFLEELKSKKIKMGIATSNSMELVDAVCERHHLRDYIDVIVTACSVAKGKPAPDVYLEAARQLGVSNERCLVFEDIVKGLEAGIHAGMKVCAVEDSYSATQRRDKMAICDYYIDSYDEIMNHTYYTKGTI